MVGRRWMTRSIVGRALLRSLAVLALGAQVSAIAAPLIDVPDTPPHAAVAMATAGGASLEQSSTPAHHHNAATCAACIAQSIVALNSGAPASVAALPGASRVRPSDARVSIAVGVRQVVRSRGPPTIS
jgi:hypothetical protein